MDISKENRLVELRKRYNLTQQKLAKEIDVSTTTISNIENNKNLMSIDIAIQIAAKYDVSLDWLYGLQDEKSNIFDSFRTFFSMNKKVVRIDKNTSVADFTFLTMQLSSVARDYFLKMSEIERINEESDLPEEAYKAWCESVAMAYKDKLENEELNEKVEFVLVQNNDNFANDVAYCIARRQLKDESERAALDKLNYD